MALFIAVLIVMVIMLYFMYVTLKAGIQNANRKVNKFFLDKIEELRMNYEALPEEEITEEEHVQKLVKPARKVWDKEIRAFPISDHSVTQLKE